MKFPLSACPFQPLELTASEKDTIQSISDGILTETMAEYERMLVHGNGVLDTERWKLIKRKENLAAYQDRCALAVTLQASSSTTKPTVDSVEDPISPPPAPAASLGGSAKNPLQRVLWHGTINCDLDDLMLGIVNQNADMWKVKSSYVEDNGLDYFLLASIKERTVEKPFEGLQLKWTVNDMGPLMAKPIMRPRDFVFMESTGITQSPTTGERMGYHICHSLELPGVPELPNYKLVRGKHELYHIFRQKSKGIVEVYVRALCDLQGEMPSTSVSLFSAEAMSTLTLSAFCAERHKVMWLLHTMVPCESGKPSLDLCSVCTKDLSKSLLPFMNKACRICSGRICARCRIPKRISFLNRRTRGVIKKNIDICTRCVHTSAHMSALTVAQGELALENPTAIFYESAQERLTQRKPVKKKENIVVYEDQLAIEEIKRRKRKAKSLGDIIESTRVGDILTRSVGPGTFRPSATAFTRETEVSEPKEMPKMIWMGTVECELDDLMYGLVSQSDEVTRIKSSYSGNSIQDFATLASLETSTASDPFRGLQLKWEVNRALTKAKPVWRCRDFVYLEATGVTKSRSTGQRIGYQILHSLDVRGVPELPGRKLTRGKVTIYQLFRQKSKGTVEVFAKAMVDLAGDVPTSMASFATIEAASAVNKAAKCARKRKLNWLLATAETNSTNYSSVECNDSCCSVLSFIKPDKNSFVVKQKALDLCTRCVHTATQMNARRVALEERAREHPASMYKYVRRQKQSSLEESSCFEEFDLSKATEKDIEDCPSPRTVLLDRATQGLHRLF
ncbi:hypothetical protein JG688_00003773 [Phytophthora aleatoria]|uniref:START domain-containing protein n=1 Tax=Phytophthora aleatoria TaxID=2496075 RepID=A0A8J5J1K7_9STRA|nr:hypothetical protein JG688_00003773 [Phytophthora aleatoria]